MSTWVLKINATDEAARDLITGVNWYYAAKESRVSTVLAALRRVAIVWYGMGADIQSAGIVRFKRLKDAQRFQAKLDCLSFFGAGVNLDKNDGYAHALITRIYKES